MSTFRNRNSFTEQITATHGELSVAVADLFVGDKHAAEASLQRAMSCLERATMKLNAAYNEITQHKHHRS